MTKSSGRDPDKDVTVNSNPERVLHNGLEIIVGPNITTIVEYPQIAFQFLETALDAVTGPVSGAGNKGNFDGHNNKAVSEELLRLILCPFNPVHKPNCMVEFGNGERALRP